MKRLYLAVLACAVCITLTFHFTRTQSVQTAAYPAEGYTVVIDAGHGGEDGGAVSPTGTRESDINLAVALKTDSLLRLLGVKTVMVRRDDVSIHDAGAATIRQKKVSDLKNRVKLVNETPDAALLSIHQNIFGQSQYSGAQVFYGANPASKLWAEDMQSAIGEQLDTNNKRAAKRVDSSVYLFKNVSCPAVLVECGFLSNSAEEKLLLDAGYQLKLACVIAAGVTKLHGYNEI